MAAARMFPLEHPQVRSVTDAAYATLTEILKDRDQLVIGIVEDELVFDNQISFDLSTMMQLFIATAKKKGIEKIYFQPETGRDELVRFISFLLSKEEAPGNVQDHFVALGIQNIKVSRLTTPMEQQKKEKVGPQESYEELLKQVLQAHARILGEQKIQTNAYVELKMVVFNIMERLMGRYQEFLPGPDPDQVPREAVHSLNTALLSVHFASKIALGHENVLDIGISSLLFDIGRAARRQNSRFAEVPADDERALSVLGAKILAQQAHNLGHLPATVAFERLLPCEPGEGAGLAVPQKPHTASTIVAICSGYDAINLGKDPGESYPPDLAYELMTRKSPGRYHPHLLAKFFGIMGIWPAGSLVRLSDGSVAVVREQHEEDLFSPRVEVVFPEEDKKVVDLKLKDHGLTIIDTLNPSGEGKKYRHLI